MTGAARDGAVPTVVIGAGVVGVCCARYLQLRGQPVTLLDRVPMGEGCSYGNAGVLSSWSCEPMSRPDVWRDMPRWMVDPEGPVALKLGYLPRLAPWLLRFLRAGRAQRIGEISDAMFTLNHPTVEYFRQLIAGSGHESLVVDSRYVYVSRDPQGLDQGARGWRLRREHGAPITVLAAGEIRELEPDLSPEYVRGVAIAHQGRVTNPARLVKVIGELVREDGGQFRRTEVLGVRPREGGGAVVDTDRGTVDAPRLVIAAGAWSHRLARPFGVDIPLQGERGYHVEFRNPGVTIHNSVQDADRMCVASSMEGGVRCAGTSEFNSLDAPADWRRARVMKTLVKTMFPGLNTGDYSEWMGRRPTLPDTIPVIGPIPDHPQVFLAFGHGHLGLTGAPMTGRMIAAMATGERLNVDMTPYRAERFG